ncbi:MAG: hypothetical protein L3K18_04225 [Thermoplasmata archaeon]|nr:hypothetical protein [Thermoplasmata archaeon]MCI4356335.1 hypothetical protein [Thermoplasmata archaeon]
MGRVGVRFSLDPAIDDAGPVAERIGNVIGALAEADSDGRFVTAIEYVQQRDGGHHYFVRAEEARHWPSSPVRHSLRRALSRVTGLNREELDREYAAALDAGWVPLSLEVVAEAEDSGPPLESITLIDVNFHRALSRGPT